MALYTWLSKILADIDFAGFYDTRKITVRGNSSLSFDKQNFRTGSENTMWKLYSSSAGTQGLYL